MTKEIGLSDGSKRKIKITLGTFEQIEEETGLDYFELLQKGGLKPKHITKIISASLVGNPTLSSREVADLIEIVDLESVVVGVMSAFTKDDGATTEPTKNA